MRTSLLLVISFFALIGAQAQTASPQGGKAWTVTDIFQHGDPLGDAPSLYLWAPGSASVTYLASDKEHGQPNDITAINATNGASSVLIPAKKLAAIYAAPNDERNRDHRARYGQSSYHWSPDGKQILFDAAGTIWMYNTSSGSLAKTADSGIGSGDDPKFSPDGKHVSYIRGHNLHVVTTEGSNDAALTTTANDTLLNGKVDWVYQEELTVSSNYFWSPDSKHIAYLQMDESTVPAYPITDWNPVHSTVYEQRYPQPGDPNPGVRVGIINANGGTTKWLQIPLSHHNDYIPRFDWLDSHHLWIEVLDRDQKHILLYFADTTTGTVRKVFTETANKFFQAAYDINFLNAQFLLTSWRDGHTHLYLYSYNAKDPLAGDTSLIRQVTHGDWEVLSLAGIDTKRSLIYYTSNETDPREEMLWQINMDGTGKKMLSTQHGVHHISFAPDNQHYVDTVSNVMSLPVASICDLADTCTAFWQPRPLDGYKLVAPIQFTARAADGSALYGQLLLPPGMTASASVPLIVNPYGGAEVQTVRDEFGGQEFLFDQLLMQHGFAVLHVDNRGMGNRGRTFAEFAYRNFGPIQFQDQLTVLDQMLARYRQLDPKRLGWWGWSWGGSFTLYAMTHSDRFAAGVCVAPVTAWDLYDSVYTERYLGLPAENQQTYHDDSDVNYAAHLHGNLLMVQGTGDDNVHMQNTIQMIQQFVTADVPYRLMLYPRKTHSIAGADARIHLFSAILQHFETTLQPAAN
jgi:dipeptidyl-peptidase-4